MLVTVFCDASFEHKTGAAAWAGWVKSQRGKIEHAALIKHPVQSSGEAEMAAIVNALCVAKLAGIAVAGDEILVQTDCLDAIGCFQRRDPGCSKKRKDRAKRARRQVLIDGFIRHSAGFLVRFKHVKAHTKNTDARSYVNKVCDKAAYKLMRGEMKKRRPPKGKPDVGPVA